MKLLFDWRWPIHSGIGRFGSELSRELNFPFQPLVSKYNPTNPLSAISLESRHFDIFYTPGFIPIFQNVRQIVTVFDLIHAHFPQRKSQEIYFKKILPTFLAKGKIQLATGTSSMARDLSNFFALEVSEILIIPPGLSSVFYSKEHQPSNVNLLYVGTNLPHKNFKMIVKSFPFFPKNWHLTIVTNDQEVVQLVRDYKNVTLVSGVNDQELAELYRKASALLLPSYIEGFGLPALEAIACGTPVVHQGLESVRNLSGISAIEVSIKDSPTAFIEAIEVAIELDYARLLAESVRVRSLYSWKSSAQVLENFIYSL